MKCDFCQEEIQTNSNKPWGKIVERNGRRPLCIDCLKAISVIGIDAMLSSILGR